MIIEARWYEPFLQNYTKKADFENYSGPLWDPKLIIVNLEAVQAGINEVAESIKVSKNALLLNSSRKNRKHRQKRSTAELYKFWVH